MSVQFLIVLVPVILGMMGFAIDLGRIYLIRGELNQAASAMALAAAAQLNGSTASTTAATAAAIATMDPASATANRYNFGSLTVGRGDTLLSDFSPSFAWYGSLQDAQTGATTSDSLSARYVSVNLTAEAPLAFWGLFSFGQARKASLAAAAIAGVSAPLCTACGIEPFAIVGDTTDAANFGFVQGNLYTLGRLCNGAAPGPLVGTRLPYVIIEGFNATLTQSDDEQLFRTGAQGLLPSVYSSTSPSCATVNATKTQWSTITTGACAAGANALVTAALCGVSSRLAADQPLICQNNTVLATAATSYAADTDQKYIVDYADFQDNYLGNNRRILTLPVVDSLTTLTIVGFRQFLLEPNADGTPNNPADNNGRFIAMYLGSVTPAKQGRFDGACALTTGPGKAVLHQ